MNDTETNPFLGHHGDEVGTPAAQSSADDDHDARREQGDEDGEVIVVGEGLQLSQVQQQRMGTTSSARFNILSTMVGGGSLSLPLAFQKSGNALVGPILLITTAIITEFCFRVHVGSARIVSPVLDSEIRPGKDSFESIARVAFGTSANIFSMALVTAMCFFGTVGYAVLLRDMLQPVTDHVWNAPGESIPGPSFHNNLTMLSVCLLVTPLCTLTTLTSLEKFGAASMFSVLILGTCVLYRSVQCQLGMMDDDHHDRNDDHDNNTTNITTMTHNYDYYDLYNTAMLTQDQQHHWQSFKLLPDSWKDLLDVFPLFVSCYVCHYNLLPVHNELNRPTSKRVGWWLRSTTWVATSFYLTIGMAGSAYGRCTKTGHVQGNILLDFNEDDPLLLVGRMCLALTITLAFPMLTIPARDIVIRSCCCCLQLGKSKQQQQQQQRRAVDTDVINSNDIGDDNALDEPLLVDDGTDLVVENGTGTDAESNETQPESVTPFWLRLFVAILVFWSAAAVASCVSSIDVVWDLLGSSLSILLSYLIPCGSYLVIVNKFADTPGSGPHDLSNKPISKKVSWIIVVVFIPLMIISTANAVYDTFFKND